MDKIHFVYLFDEYLDVFQKVLAVMKNTIWTFMCKRWHMILIKEKL